VQIRSGNPETTREPAAETPPGGLHDSRRFWTRLGLLLVLGIVVAIRLRLLNCPLERDEGEFAYGGQLLLQGASPYDGAYTVGLKLPGTTASYALFMALFGQTTAGIHLGLTLVNLADALLVFLVARRIFGGPGGVVAAGTFALFTIVPETDGLAAHATHFVLLPALAGIALLQNLDAQTSRKRIFSAGLLLGLALVMKQTGAIFGLFAAAWVLRCELLSAPRSWPRLTSRLALLAAGGALPFLLTCLIVAAAGDFHQFWFWAFTYAAAHGSVFDLRTGLWNMGDACLKQFLSAPGLWFITLAGVAAVLWEKSLREWRFFLAGLAVFSFVSVCPGWYFRGHYFIQFFPAAGLLAAAAFHAMDRLWTNLKISLPAALPAVVFAAAGVAVLVQWNSIFFNLPPAQACRAIYGFNPFPEAVEISRYLKDHSSPDARIAVLGSEPEIFFYTQCRSATGHICTYPLVENQPYAETMRREMTQQIEQADPEYVVYVSVPSSWIQTTGKMDRTLIDWFMAYRQKHLNQVGLVDLQLDGTVGYQWGAGRPFSLGGPYDPWIAVFKKR
jgi:hypothetical protein